MAARRPKTTAPATDTAPRTIALEDLTITWTRAPIFAEAGEHRASTLRGRDLPAVLQVLSILNPGRDWKHIVDAEDIARDAGGLADLVELLSYIDDISDKGISVSNVLWFLSRRLRELAALSSAAGATGGGIETACLASDIAVTVMPPAPDGAR
jgi:hypothetical protein